MQMLGFDSCLCVVVLGPEGLRRWSSWGFHRPVGFDRRRGWRRWVVLREHPSAAPHPERGCSSSSRLPATLLPTPVQPTPSATDGLRPPPSPPPPPGGIRSLLPSQPLQHVARPALPQHGQTPPTERRRLPGVQSAPWWRRRRRGSRGVRGRCPLRRTTVVDRLHPNGDQTQCTHSEQNRTRPPRHLITLRTTTWKYHPRFRGRSPGQCQRHRLLDNNNK